MNLLRAHLKLLLATAIAALALGSVGVGSAQAVPTFTAGSYPTTLVGSQAESFIFTITGSGYEVTCTNFSLSGSMTEAETMLVLTPTYTNCQAVEAGTVFGATIRVNKCFWTVQVTSKKTNGEFTHIGTANLECFPNELVEIEILSGKTLDCEYTIEPASGLSEMQYGTMAATPNDLTAHWLVKKLPYRRRVGSALLCGTANGNAEYTGNATIRGFNEKGTQVNLEVTGS